MICYCGVLLGNGDGNGDGNSESMQAYMLVVLPHESPLGKNPVFAHFLRVASTVARP